MKFFTNKKKEFKKWLSGAKLRRHAEDDLLTEKQRTELDALLAEAGNSGCEKHQELQNRFEKILPRYRHAGIRELLDLLVVVGAVAFGIRALYFQPFRIPTSSMQPTLYGIHYMSRANASNPLLGKLPAPLNYALFSAQKAYAEVQEDGELDPESLSHQNGLFKETTSFTIGNYRYTLPGDPRKVVDYASLAPRPYKKGEVLADGFRSLGDHLFVERFSLYLTPPRRGDVMVFTTEGLRAYDKNLSEQSGFYYVKRLVGLPGDTLKIINNVLFIRPAGGEKFVPAAELAPVFDKIYSGKGGYQGHLSFMGEHLNEPGKEFHIPADHYFMMGDNSQFSLDSRFFGAVPRRNLIGRAWLVFWPISRRWGLVDRQPPVDVPTGEARGATFPSMYLQ